MDGRTEPISTDAAYETLANSFRRDILCLLAKHDSDTTSIAELVTCLSTLYEVSEAQIATAVKHIHLPKLQRVGFIECDERSGAIRYRQSDFLTAHFEADVIDCKACSKAELPIENLL